MTHKDNYTLVQKLESKTQLVISLEKRLINVTEELRSSNQMVENLQKEIKLQEDFFKKASETTGRYYAELAEKQLTDERQVRELVTKLSQDQVELNKYKKDYQRHVKEARDMGFDQVKILQVELQKQSEFFRLQEKGYRDEIEQLKKEISVSQEIIK